MTLPRQDQEARGAKKKAIKNAARQTKTQECNSNIRPRPSCPQKENWHVTGAYSKSELQLHWQVKQDCGIKKAVNTESIDTLKTRLWYLHWALAEHHHDMVDSDSDDDLLEAPLMVEAQYRRPAKLCQTYAMQDVALPKDEDEQSADSDANGNESSATDGEDEDLAAMRLSDEVVSVVTNKQQVASKSCGTSKAKLAQDHHKQAVETPTWANMDVECAVSESIKDCSTGGDSSEFQLSDNEGTAPTRKLTSDAKTQSIALLIKTESGKVKLLDQNLETHRVLQSTIVEVKCHLYFANGYPELVDKNQVALQALIVVAKKCGVHSIKECLQSDERYASQLGSLVDARVPILRCELKEDACAHADGYFCLGHTDTGKAAARRLLDKFAYIYALKFDINNEASPIGKKPYQGELLIFLIYRQLFHSSKSIAIKFAERFVEIANNKGQHPEVPIPLLALVATAVYTALLWKSQGSSSKFNFTGNLFSETYNYHVRFLEKLKKDAPAKFHCMMADIYEAAQKLRYSGATTGGHAAELEAFELLDLDNMEED
ncbi:uncharacterized protein EDB93DRAFT_1257653 [Suillus bovinus]|uniref:uncharacterized protein n=1 Tax=Suillus bovinus TaxID=48563 RepID=UPI001B87F82E|nr:uncharacterized protein EDB93DRAFT_1257653 [Suillus bovinus]KAG2126250.1 hypothetical protein EDB93DRAFT_1257653 [Suillus bovinus]